MCAAYPVGTEGAVKCAGAVGVPYAVGGPYSKCVVGGGPYTAVAGIFIPKYLKNTFLQVFFRLFFYSIKKETN